jgi:cyclophilin family peptidyl-prolyl cis-trans isomerase/HEAT repeat protein
MPPSEEEKITDIHIDIKDSVYQKIHDFQDRLLSDSLFPFFHHRNPAYRYLAAMAFASIRDKTAVDSLALLLNDDLQEVRAAAAYAIGQAGESSAEKILVDAFDRTDTSGRSRLANRAILEAIGKCASPSYLEALSTVSTYQATDTALLEGQALGIYRYALRDITHEQGTRRMVDLVTRRNYPSSVRLIAANYLMRARNLELDTFSRPLIETINSEENPDIRMALAVAIGKIPSDAAMQTLPALFQRETDYRVKCNILRTLGNFDYQAVQATALQALKDTNRHVAGRAAQFFLESGIPEDASMYWRTARDTLPWEAQLTLYQAANRHLPANLSDYRNALNSQLRQRFRTATSPYEKAMTLRALAEFGWNFRFIYREGIASEIPVVKTTSMECLAAICAMPGFRKLFGSGYRNVTKEMAIYFKNAIRTGDPGMISGAATALRIPERNFKDHFENLDSLQISLDNLSLPRDIETYNELKKTIDFFNGKTESEPRKPDFNHPIDWELIHSLVDTKPRAKIQTPSGTIEVELLLDLAPATVANFVQLARDGFFDGKNFHRVVPNFVIQGGCPRGDGYGSLDYTIRSELPPASYDRQGYVGMASAGNHTECTQFFITHSPTLHLDGNYTIFGKVVKGMEAVHRIQISDAIQKITIE